MRQLIVGRDRERAVVGEALAATRVGSSRPVVVRGEPGLGKSTLLGHAVDAARAEGFGVLELVAHPVDTAVAGASLRLALWSLAAGNGTAEVPTLLARARQLLGADDGVVDGAAVAEAVRHLLVAWAQRRPVLVAVDDLHVADPVTTAVLLYLMRHLRGERVLLVATARSLPGDLDPAVAEALRRYQAAGRLDEVTLAAMDVAEVRVLLSARLGVAPQPALVEALASRTAGNPFFVVELLDALQGAGALTTLPSGLVALQAGAHGDGDGDDLELPRTVAVAVLHRVFQLGPDARAVAGALAVLEELPTRELPLASSMAGLDPARTAEAFDRLVAARVLGEGPSGYRFTQPIVAEVLYRDLGPAVRQELHRRAAVELDRRPEPRSPRQRVELGRHVRLAGRLSLALPDTASTTTADTAGATVADERAAVLLEAAGDAVLAGDPAAVAGWFTDARPVLAATAAGRGRLDAKLIRALALGSRSAAALEAARTALRATDPGPEPGRAGTAADVGRAALDAAFALSASGHGDEAAMILHAVGAAPALRSVPLPRARALLAIVDEQPQEARRLQAEAARSRPGPADDESVLAEAVAMLLARADGRGHTGEAHAARLRALAGFPPFERARRALCLGFSLVLDGDPGEALTALAPLLQSGALVVAERSWSAWALYRLGRWDEASAAAGAALAAADADPRGLAAGLHRAPPPLPAAAVAALLAVAAERGDAAAVRQARTLGGRVRRERHLLEAAEATARTLEGEAGKAVGDLRSALARERPSGRVDVLSTLLQRLAESAVAAADVSTARAVLDELEALPWDGGGVTMVVERHLTRARVLGDPEAAAAARGVALSHRLAPAAADAMMLEGVRRGHAEMLLAAHGELERLGATLRQADAVRHLRRLGRRPPRRRRVGVLSGVESEVARLVARGMTNKKIAEEVNLSPKTVEVYLSRIYAKTGFGSRVELALAVSDGRLSAPTEQPVGMVTSVG